jgi:hypothetical protein
MGLYRGEEVSPTEIYITEMVYPIAKQLLPEKMGGEGAWRLLTAIGGQESKFMHRVQVKGPARSFWQFEENGGVAGVLRHEETSLYAEFVCNVLGYPADKSVVYEAMAHNDVLAACFARLLLWTDSRAIPPSDKPADGWLIYISTWRPGKPHPQTWNAHFQAAWSTGQKTLRA